MNPGLPIRIITVFLLFSFPMLLGAQPGTLSYDLPHPKKFENRKLRSEKTGDMKFTVPRKFMQNTTSHYNFFFNANERLKDIMARAKAAHRDDYTKLLSFYNYSTDATAQYRTDLDSIIYRATAGILLHDLRSNWVDNFYLLMGQAYFLKKEYDSAFLTFQFLNYAFSPKDEDGYDKVIGSNSNEGGSAFSVSTNEKTSVVKKVFSRPPSRNEALVWQVRTYVTNEEMPEAATLIQTLKNDPLFPPRLQPALAEVEGLYYYEMQKWDSSAVYLEKALDNAENKQEAARWEYLIAQMYEATGNHQLSKEFYERVLKHTIDPVMEVYALLNSIRQGQGTDDKARQEAVDALSKMGHRDKYVMYRDIIYYTAAEIERDRNQNASAKTFLEKSIKYNSNNLKQKSRSYLALAEISYADKDFINAKRYYDSTDIHIIEPEDLAAFRDRKAGLAIIANRQMVINRQDSLQKIAAMPDAEREAYVRKLVKQMRKQQGLKDEDNFGNTSQTVAGNDNASAPVDLFSAASGDWYFSNNSLKTRGYADFKTKWGNRPNVDNWQRSAAIKQAAASNDAAPAVNLNGLPEERQISYEALTRRLPLTPEKIKMSNDSILRAQFDIGKALQDNLEEYRDAANAYETLLSRFPDSNLEEQTLYNLYYCYKKLGEEQKMAAVKSRMDTKFAKGRYTAIVNNPAALDTGRKKEVSPVYESIYNLFIEGRFDEAVARKQVADSIYGKTYWTPQLLYIEAVYYISRRNDSTAKTVLNNIVRSFPGTPMANKAKNLIDVLSRRAQIEDYLTKLQIERPPEDSTAEPVIVSRPPVPAPVVANNPSVKKDSTQSGKQPSVVTKPVVSAADTSKLAGRPVATDKNARVPMDSSQVQKAAALNGKPVKPGIDTSKLVNKAAAPSAVYSYTPAQAHYVVLVMDNVDPVYVNEAKNAFARYDREHFSDRAIDISSVDLTSFIRFMLIGKFDNAAAAIDYLGKASAAANTDIIPWMPAPKYSFMIITDQNLEILKNTKDLSGYKNFIRANFKDAVK